MVMVKNIWDTVEQPDRFFPPPAVDDGNQKHHLDISSTSEQTDHEDQEPTPFKQALQRIQPYPCQRYHRCGKNDCLPCAWIYGKKQINSILFNIQGNQKPRLNRIILTIQSSPEDSLKTLLEKLFSSFHTFKRTSYFQKYIRGGLFHLHVTQHIDTWHPHLDILVEPHLEKTIHGTDIKNQWLTITTDSFITTCQDITPTDQDRERLVVYLMKPTFLTISGDPTLMKEYKQAITHKRKFSRFGNWVNTKTNKSWKKIPVIKSPEIDIDSVKGIHMPDF